MQAVCFTLSFFYQLVERLSYAMISAACLPLSATTCLDNDPNHIHPVSHTIIVKFYIKKSIVRHASVPLGRQADPIRVYAAVQGIIGFFYDKQRSPRLNDIEIECSTYN